MALTKLSRREFWVKQRGRRNPLKLRTQDMPDITLTPEIEKMKKELLDYSGARFGRLKDDVRRKYVSTNVADDEPIRKQKAGKENNLQDDSDSLWSS